VPVAAARNVNAIASINANINANINAVVNCLVTRNAAICAELFDGSRKHVLVVNRCESMGDVASHHTGGAELRAGVVFIYQWSRASMPRARHT
jgi:hypothetical protein